MGASKKSAIALLITLLFVISITASIGIGLKYVTNASKVVDKERFVLQSRIAITDILEILQNAPEIEQIVKSKAPENLYTFLSQSSFIPFENSGIRMLVQMKSARSKFNPNNIFDKNQTKTMQNIENLKEYIVSKEVNPVFVDIMLDMMSGIKEDLVYNSDIFYEKPELYRDKIVSREHFGEIKDFYESSYHDDSLKNIEFDRLFHFTTQKDTKIDLNYATPELWEMMLMVDRERALEIANGNIPYKSTEDIGLSDYEKEMLSRFKTSFFEPYINVKIEMIQDNYSSKIEFEYDLEKRRGMNFSYEI